MVETLGEVLHGIAVAEVGIAMTTLAESAGHPHRAVHETRKAIRRCRAVLALASGVAGHEAEAAGRAMRGVARRLSKLRDAHVAVELVDAQRKTTRSSARRALWVEVRDLLKQRRDATLAATRAADPKFKRLRARLGRARLALARQDWRSVDAAAVAGTLAQSARAVERAAGVVATDPTRAEKHRLRRRVRRLRMQLEALIEVSHLAADAAVGEQACAAMLGVGPDCSQQALSERSDRLGVELDLRLLRGILRKSIPAGQRKQVLPAIRRRLAEFEAPGGKEHPARNRAEDAATEEPARLKP